MFFCGSRQIVEANQLASRLLRPILSAILVGPSLSLHVVTVDIIVLTQYFFDLDIAFCILCTCIILVFLIFGLMKSLISLASNCVIFMLCNVTFVCCVFAS